MSANSELAGQFGGAAVKAAPPLTYTGLTVYGIQLPDIVAIATLIYLVVQMYLLIEARLKKGGSNDG